MILKCTCKHDYQDKLYGYGRRVHNIRHKGKIIGYRCTVCGNTKDPQNQSALPSYNVE